MQKLLTHCSHCSFDFKQYRSDTLTLKLCHINARARWLHEITTKSIILLKKCLKTSHSHTCGWGKEINYVTEFSYILHTIQIKYLQILHTKSPHLRICHIISCSFPYNNCMWLSLSDGVIERERNQCQTHKIFTLTVCPRRQQQRVLIDHIKWDELPSWMSLTVTESQ